MQCVCMCVSWVHTVTALSHNCLHCCIFYFFSLNDHLVIQLINRHFFLSFLLRSSLSSPALPSLSQARELFIPALSVALVGFSFHSTLSSVFAHKHDYHVDLSQVHSQHFDYISAGIEPSECRVLFSCKFHIMKHMGNTVYDALLHIMNILIVRYRHSG